MARKDFKIKKFFIEYRAALIGGVIGGVVYPVAVVTFGMSEKLFWPIILAFATASFFLMWKKR